MSFTHSDRRLNGSRDLQPRKESGYTRETLPGAESGSDSRTTRQTGSSGRWTEVPESCAVRNTEVFCCAFRIAQVPFAFEFECNRPNSKSATVCHRITIHQICRNLGCARFAVFLEKYFEFQILWSLSSVDFFLSKSKSQFQLDFNLHFVFVLDTLPSQWCRNIFLKINF